MPSFLFFFLISPTNTASFTHAHRHKKHPSTLLLRLWKDGKRYCISEDEPDEERPDGAYQQEEPGIGQFVFLH